VARALAAGWPANSTFGGVWPALRVAEIFRSGHCEKLLRDAGATSEADLPVPLASGTQLDAPLRLKAVVMPDDPRGIQEEFSATQVRVEFLVDAEGRVLFPRVIDAHDPRLGPAVFETLRHWRFEPPQRGGQPVATRAVAPLIFPASTDRAFSIADVQDKPKAISRIAPSYPYEAKQAQASGSVVIEFIVTAEGTVANARIVSSSHRIFEAAALASIRQWRFEPGKINGRPVNTKMQQTIVFNVAI
jgi:TonB family protein